MEKDLQATPSEKMLGDVRQLKNIGDIAKLSPEEMKALGDKAVSMLVSLLQDLNNMSFSEMKEIYDIVKDFKGKGFEQVDECLKKMNELTNGKLEAPLELNQAEQQNVIKRDEKVKTELKVTEDEIGKNVETTADYTDVNGNPTNESSAQFYSKSNLAGNDSSGGVNTAQRGFTAKNTVNPRVDKDVNITVNSDLVNAAQEQQNFYEQAEKSREQFEKEVNQMTEEFKQKAEQGREGFENDASQMNEEFRQNIAQKQEDFNQTMSQMAGVDMGAAEKGEAANSVVEQAQEASSKAMVEPPSVPDELRELPKQGSAEAFMDKKYRHAAQSEGHINTPTITRNDGR